MGFHSRFCFCLLNHPSPPCCAVYKWLPPQICLSLLLNNPTAYSPVVVYCKTNIFDQKINLASFCRHRRSTEFHRFNLANALRPTLVGLARHCFGGIVLLPLLALVSSPAADSPPRQGQTVVSFNDGQRVEVLQVGFIAGIVSAGPLFVVQRQNSLVLFRTATNGSTPVPLYEMASASETITDLKLDMNWLVVCFTSSCRICAHSPYHCTEHKFIPAESIRSVLTEPDGLRLFVRAVYSADSAALMAIDWTKGDEEEQRLTAKDDKNIGEHRVVAGFQAGDFIYFFGSANRPDLPLKLDLDESRRRTDVRLTRVCKGDTSQMPQQNEKALESRMELVISCGREIGKSADKREIPMPERAVAASQSMDGKSLLVVIEREQSDGQKRNLVCQFEMAQLEAAFDRLWDQCQQVPSKRWQERQCQETKMDQPECYMFSWELEERIPLCRRFGPGGLANCALGPNTVLINRAGWLEDFRPYMGTQLAANLPVESAVVAITNGGSTGDDGDSTFILAMQNGTIQRYAANESAPLWTMIANDKFGPFGITRNPESGHLLFVNENTIRQLALECAAMYPSCEDILWADPLDCRWCAFLNGTGRTIGRDEAEQCQSGFALRSCPPVVAEVAREEGDMLTIWGKRLNLVEGLQIKVCGQYCKVDKISADTIRCKTSSAPPEGPCKSVLLQGKFEAESNFRINYDLDQQQQSQTGNRKIHPSYVMRVILVIVAILLISIALLVIYCSLYPKLAQRLLRRFTKTPPPDNGYNPIPPTEQLRDYFGRRLSSHIGHHKQNSSSYPFAELESLMVPLGNGTLLNMGTFTLIGEGHFSKVCRALCLRSPEEEHGEFVAVKIIKHSSSIKEIEDEVRVMCGCDHPNIVKYIDHFVDHMQLINIVMEYMGGGDLHNYLRDGRNLPTIMDAFRFILQITSGMDYLTNKMRIVHRDLAARNCMLDSQHQIVKITDFGLSRVLSRNRDEQNEEYIYVYSSDNMQQQLPFRWTAIECFANANPEFSEKTDVWAFGVLVWEIFARDVDPYGRMKSQEVREFLESGQRLENLPKCPDRLYDLLCQCWSADPALRPTFRAILGSVEKLYDELMAQESEYMHSQYGLLNESEYEAPRNSAGTSGSTSAGAISLSTVTTRAGNAGAPPNTSYAI